SLCSRLLLSAVPWHSLLPYTTLFRSYAPRYYEPYVLGPVIGFGFGTFWPHYHDHYHYRPPVIHRHAPAPRPHAGRHGHGRNWHRSEEHTSELQSRENLVCRLLLEKKN